MKPVLATVLLLLSTCGALAQSRADPMPQADADRNAADAAMTEAWAATYAVMKRRDAADTSRGGGFGFAPAALASQRAWLSFRDKQCVIEGGAFAGSAEQPLVRARCLTRLTRERTGQLEAMQRR